LIGGQHLYIIQSHTTGAFKVGRSSDPERRLRDLQVGSPFKLRLILVVRDQGKRERSVHRCLAGFHSQGTYEGEWFIEPGMASLPDDLYEMLDLEMVSTWWETSAGPVHAPGPLGVTNHARLRHDPGPGLSDD
jgi:hypothetical protein